MIIKTEKSSFELDKVQGFYIEKELSYHLSTGEYDTLGYVIWVSMQYDDIRITEAMSEEDAQIKLQELTDFWALYLNDIISYE